MESVQLITTCLQRYARIFVGRSRVGSQLWACFFFFLLEARSVRWARRRVSRRSERCWHGGRWRGRLPLRDGRGRGVSTVLTLRVAGHVCQRWQCDAVVQKRASQVQRRVRRHRAERQGSARASQAITTSRLLTCNTDSCLPSFNLNFMQLFF